MEFVKEQSVWRLLGKGWWCWTLLRWYLSEVFFLSLSLSVLFSVIYLFFFLPCSVPTVRPQGSRRKDDPDRGWGREGLRRNRGCAEVKKWYWEKRKGRGVTVEKLTGDTCFVSSLRRNGRFYSSPSSLSSIWFYFSVFSTFLFFFFISAAREPKRRGNRRGQTGTCQAGREGARQKSRAQLFFSSCVCGRLSVCVFASMSESVCWRVTLKQHY